MTNESQRARLLLARQRISWPAAKAGYEALGRIRSKSVLIDGFYVKVQYNPARIISSGAVTDAQYVRSRPCFLCSANMSPEQEALPIYPGYTMLCNPYPIFPEHFTLPSLRHTEQRIDGTFADFIRMARMLSGFTLFYNGPRSGASAPDHLHFQAVTGLYMPVDNDALLYREKPFAGDSRGTISLLAGYRRAGFVIEAETEESCRTLFGHIYNVLPLPEGDAEPRMNIFCRYDANRWITTVMPRIQHRPRQYYAEGSDHILAAPGAADMGGVFITSLEEDYEKITPDILCDIYGQVAFDDARLRILAQKIK
ncbi:MAG: DUF4922 domain-containing protein [Tannerellaceae bacterium]|jgi:hypothetical protein|nr:DUF4922 domain-containing protein [Tannerellaceae bacterium]